ncbi:hypothetical protein KFU94_36415 [Chloroflexi bacterium TSY]|nr:hypothetical protein [Chloroflexi bacterium TSY]
MQTILFRFHRELSVPDQEHVLAQLRGWANVQQVERFDSEPENEELFLSCYVYLSEEADIDDMVHQLMQRSEIDVVEKPADRYGFTG